MKIDLPWTEELVTRIFNEKMGWINNAKLSEEERSVEIQAHDRVWGTDTSANED